MLLRLCSCCDAKVSGSLDRRSAARHSGTIDSHSCPRRDHHRALHHDIATRSVRSEIDRFRNACLSRSQHAPSPLSIFAHSIAFPFDGSPASAPSRLTRWPPIYSSSPLCESYSSSPSLKCRPSLPKSSTLMLTVSTVRRKCLGRELRVRALTSLTPAKSSSTEKGSSESKGSTRAKLTPATIHLGHTGCQPINKSHWCVQACSSVPNNGRDKIIITI